MNVPDHIHGSIAPTFTAFNEDGTLDDAGQRHFLDFLESRGGINAYFIRAGMGQMYAFSVEDVQQLAANVCGHLAGRKPVLVGCNGHWNRDYTKRPDEATFIQQGVELGKYVQDLGAAGVVHTIPEALDFNGRSKEELFLHYFGAIAEAVDLPVYIYQPPASNSAYHLDGPLLGKLAEIDNICGAKVSSPDGELIFNLAYATREQEFSYIVGCETAFYAGLYAGATAAIGQGTILNPHILNAVQERFDAGDRAGALEAQASVNLLCQGCGNPVDFLKRYSTEKGFPIKPCFRTMIPNPYGTDPQPLSDDAYTRFKALFEAELEKYAPATV